MRICIWYNAQVNASNETLPTAIWFLIGITAAYAVGYARGVRKRKSQEITLVMNVQLDATQAIAIKAKGKDSEGNIFDLDSTELTLSIENAVGDFGTINDDNDTFNPGAAGATGTIVGTATVNGVECKAEVDVELVHGAAVSLELTFAPVEETTEPTEPTEPTGDEGDEETE